MTANIVHRVKDICRQTFGDFIFSGQLTEFQQHIVAEHLNFPDGGKFFRLLDIGVQKGIGQIHGDTAGNGADHDHVGDRLDEEIFGLAQGGGGQGVGVQV